MKHAKGFTLLELIIIVAIASILITIAFAALTSKNDKLEKSVTSWGVNGLTEVRCIDNYKFVVSTDGSVRQVMSETGHGVSCGDIETTTENQ